MNSPHKPYFKKKCSFFHQGCFTHELFFATFIHKLYVALFLKQLIPFYLWSSFGRPWTKYFSSQLYPRNLSNWNDNSGKSLYLILKYLGGKKWKKNMDMNYCYYPKYSLMSFQYFCAVLSLLSLMQRFFHFMHIYLPSSYSFHWMTPQISKARIIWIS